MTEYNLDNTTYEQFKQSQTVVQQFANQYNKQLNTHTGSIIKQLLLRPLSFLYAKLNNLYRTFVQQTSIQYLSTSQKTVNDVADAIASNYFMQRNAATRASGSVVVQLKTSNFFIAKATKFSIAGITFQTINNIYITASQTTSAASNTIVVVSVYDSSTNTYKAIIPVQAVDAGYVQLPAGVQVTLVSSSSGLVGAQLLSPITGGADVQTDAQLMQRLKDTYATGNSGTQVDILKRLQQADLGLISCNATAGNTNASARYFDKKLGINKGCCVDVFCKTANQPRISRVKVRCEKVGTKCVLTLPKQASAGLLQISKVMLLSSTQPVTQVEQIQPSDYTVVFSSSQTQLSAQDARLSAYQQVAIQSTTAFTQQSYYNVYYSYTANIEQLQEYINNQQHAIIGQQIFIKAAPPICLQLDLTIDSSVTLSQTYINQIKTDIAKLVNTYPVGSSILNLTDIARQLAQLYSNISIALPCSVTAHIPTKAHGIYTIIRQSGVLDLTDVNQPGIWQYKTSFMYITASDITLKVR